MEYLIIYQMENLSINVCTIDYFNTVQDIVSVYRWTMVLIDNPTGFIRQVHEGKVSWEFLNTALNNQLTINNN